MPKFKIQQNDSKNQKIANFTGLTVPENTIIEYPGLYELKKIKGKRIFTTKNAREFVDDLVDAISKEGDYLGGAIAPGIGIAAEALFIRTAKLPRVDLQRPPQAIGSNTVHAMQSGLLFGYVSLVEGMVVRFRRELGKEMRVIATGGLAEIIAAETEIIEDVAPWLTLDGLRIIWEMNQ